MRKELETKNKYIKIINYIDIFIRSLLYNIIFILWTFIWAGSLLPLAILSKKIAIFISYWWAVILMKLLKILCRIDLVIEGKNNLPQSTCIIASKHESTWDTLFLFTLLRGPVFILKKELLYLPIYGIYMILLDMIAINRSRGRKSVLYIVSKVKKLKKSNRKIIIFPQGTRTLPNEKIPYKSGIYAIAKECNVSVVPMALNSGSCWGKKAFMKYPGTIKVSILPVIEINQNKQNFMQNLENKIEKKYKEISRQ